jgi:hypothetical protein
VVRVTRRLVLGCLAAGVALRVVLLTAPEIWYDEATNGLMTLAVLRGDLPLYFFGQPFMGALDAYLAAPFHYLLGPAVLTLKLLPLALTLAWLVLTVRLTWTAFGPRAAAFAAALLAVPPDFLLSWSIETRTKYHVCVALGTLALLVALQSPARRPGRDVLRFAVLGLILGLAFWTNFLSVVFVPPVAILLARHGPWPVLRGLPGAVLAFGVGSLPHWIYGLSHGTAVPRAGGWIGWRSVGEHVGKAWKIAWPIMAGVPASLQDERAGHLLSIGLGVAFLLLFAAGARVAWRSRGAARAAVLGLLVMITVNVGIAVGTQHGERIDNDPKYFLPLYTAIPALAGVGLATLPTAAGAPLLAALLAVQGAGAVEGELQALTAGGRARLANDRQARDDAMAAIRQQGLQRFYAASPNPSILMYLSGERVIVSDPYQESYPPYARAVDGAPRVGWWFGGRDANFESHLAALGVQSTFLELGPRGGAYADFSLPAEHLRELNPTGLRATASVNAEAAASIFDRDAATFWSTGQAQKGGEWIEVDLGSVEPVTVLRWLPNTFQEIPAGLRVEASRDRITWQRLVDLPEYAGPLYWSAGRPMLRVRSGRVELRFPPMPTRYLRITQTGREGFWYWTVNELFVYATDPGGPVTVPDGEGEPLVRAVRAAGVRRLYADHGWAYRLAMVDPGLRVLPANLPLDAYNFTGPQSQLLPEMRWSPHSGALIEPPDATGFLRTAELAGLGVKRTNVGGMILFTYAPPLHPPGYSIPPTQLRVSASVASDRAARAADARRHTRWTTGRARAAGDWLRIDLAAPRRIRAVDLRTTEPDEAPGGIMLEGSVDGQIWTPLPAEIHAESRVRWAGITWLRDGASRIRLEVPPVTVRALRLTLTKGDRERAWSVHELTVEADD